jgi:hypothetical protein
MEPVLQCSRCGNLFILGGRLCVHCFDSKTHDEIVAARREAFREAAAYAMNRYKYLTGDSGCKIAGTAIGNGILALADSDKEGG